MANIVADLGKSILEKLMNNAIAESRYICCFSCIVKDFEDEKEVLKATRMTVDEYTKVEKRKGNNIRADVTFWQERAEELIHEDTQMKKTCFFGWCPNCKWRYSKGKQLANKKKEIERLLESKFDNGNVGISLNLPGVEYHSSQDYVSFESRKLTIKELSDALIDDSNFIIGFQGMGGTGKTTLAKEVGKELVQLTQFDHVIDTTVSYTLDIRKIQDDIAAPLGVDFKDKNNSERLKLLWSRLTDGEKILLILDDVWNPINFEEIGIPKKDNHKGCRILLTTREMRVCQSMGCEKIIQLGVLSKEDAWTLFKKHANISDSSSKRLLDKGRDITKECKGLPVAIAAIASSLRGKESWEVWKSTLKSLQKSVSKHDVDENLVDKCLRRSYHNLKDEGAKKLFPLCSLFPEDEELSDEILTRFCRGVRLFGEMDIKYDEPRDQVVTAKNKLVNSCLLVKAGKQSVKMHDLVRDVALRIANEEIQAVNLSDKNQKSLLERGENIKYLEFNSIEVIERCTLLEELYIVGTKVRFDLSRLHGKITFPPLERYVISDYLRTVDESLSRCVALPNIDAIFSEVTFKHLVQTSELLHLVRIKGAWRNLIPDIVPIDRGMNDLFQLVLTGSPQLRCLIDTTHIDSHRQSFFSKLIELKLHRMENFEKLCNGPFPSDFLNNLQSLNFRECINLRSILFKSKLNLCYLKTTKLSYCRKLVSLFQLSTCQSLLLLEELSIEDSEQLTNIIAAYERIREELKEEIVSGENDNKSCVSMFPKLKTLYISKCPHLEYILPSPTLSPQVVPLLETIRTHDCGELKYIFHEHQHEHASQDLHQEAKDIILGSLKEVSNIDYLHLWQRAQCLSKQPHILRNIKELELQNFSKTKSVFILSIAPMMLEKLRIQDRDELQHIIIDTRDDLVDNNLSYVFPKLKKISVKDASQRIELKNTDLWVQSCPKLSLTSTIEANQLRLKVVYYVYGENLSKYSIEILQYIARHFEDLITQDTSNENQTIEITEDIEVEPDVQAQSELASSEVNTNQSIAEIEHEIVEQVSSLKISLATTSPSKRHEAHSDEDDGGQITTPFSVITRENPTTKNVQEITETHAPENYNIGHEVQATSEHELTPPQVNGNQSIQATQTEYIQEGSDFKSNMFISVETKAKPSQKAEKGFVEEVTGLEIPLPNISPTDAANAKISPLDSLLHKTHSDVSVPYSVCLI
ncbi:probable disease resistance protein At1g61300 [Abrus precatorius]|uniref:Probable disease resistance protein At1g61300 n=1 Tax=Abrus precatorius TaxID=3816 RepID=A0A8B8KAH0_ABRPR|nr:probable disease resistance protein At1g61300 [Abrus precatorius]